MAIIRRSARFVLASLLWLHAFLFFEVARPNMVPLAMKLNLNIAETTVLCAIVALSILSTYGMGNILIDLAYVYFFPFVLLYYCARGGYKIVRGINSAFAKIGTDNSERIELAKIPGWPTVPTTPVAPQAQASRNTASPPSTTPIGVRLRNTIFTPFSRFSLLWCLLLLLTSKTALVWIALAVVLFQIVKVLIAVIGIAFFSTNWLTQLEERIRSYAETWIDKILAANDTVPSNDLTQVVAALTSLQVVLVLLRNRQRVAQWAIFLGSLVFGCVYLYLSFLFSFAYCGIARLSHAHLTWANSLVDSIFIPFAFSDVAINVPLRWAAGIHGSVVVAIGITTFFGYLRRRLDSFYNLAGKLHSRLQEPAVQTKIVVVAERLKTTGQPATGQKSANVIG